MSIKPICVIVVIKNILIAKTQSSINKKTFMVYPQMPFGLIITIVSISKYNCW